MPKKKTDEPIPTPEDEMLDPILPDESAATAENDEEPALPLDGETVEDEFVEPPVEAADDNPLPELPASTWTADEAIDETPHTPGEPEEPPPEKPKRSRKKKEPKPEESAGEPHETASLHDDEEAAPAKPAAQTLGALLRRKARRSTDPDDILTIEARGDADTPAAQEEIAWHEIHNAYHTRRIISGTLDGVERLENGNTIAVVSYNDFRIVIPLKEMAIKLQPVKGQDSTEELLRAVRQLTNMIGAEIDFIVKGIDSGARSAVASRKEAMDLKRRHFFYDLDDYGQRHIYEGRLVQARIIATSERGIRIEVFGVECSVSHRYLSWDWIGDARDRFRVGDRIVVRVQKIELSGENDVALRADARMGNDDTSFENLKNCKIQSRYAGTVVDIRRGVVLLRLKNGVNAVAHSCYDRRRPGKSDEVSFVVTHIDWDRNVAVGLIAKIIKQNL